MRILGFFIFMMIIMSPTLSYSCDEEEKNAPKTDYISEYNGCEDVNDDVMDVSYTEDTSYDFADYGVTENNVSYIPMEAVVATGIWSQYLAPVDISFSSVIPSEGENLPEDIISASSPDISVLSTSMNITPLQ